MSKIEWDGIAKKFYETGVDHCVLFLRNEDGTYQTGIPWNGITSVSESPEGAEPNDLWADNIKYATLYSAETFGATIEAYTYPEEFGKCDGSYMPADGVHFGQQGRSGFGLAYRTKVGNDAGMESFKLHIIYNCKASPSEKSYETVNDSPDAITFSWEITTVPDNLSRHKPISSITIDGSKLNAEGQAKLLDIENLLFGTDSDDSRLPYGDEILDLIYTYSGSEVSFVASKAGIADKVKIHVMPTQSGTGDPSPTNPRLPVQLESVTITTADGDGNNEHEYEFEIPSSMVDSSNNTISTLYGGILNTTTGELTITHVRFAPSGTSGLNVSAITNDDTYARIIYSGSAKPSFDPTKHLSGIYSHGAYGVSSNNLYYNTEGRSQAGVRWSTSTPPAVQAVFIIPKNMLASVDSAGAAAYFASQQDAGTPISLIYEIDEPIVIPNAITPQSISILAGENVISSEQGEVEVIFRED